MKEGDQGMDFALKLVGPRKRVISMVKAFWVVAEVDEDPSRSRS